MQNHTKIYLDHFNIGIEDYVYCEICGGRTVDIHHIDGRGSNKNVIENLMALCRHHHNMCGAKIIINTWAKEIHQEFLLISPYNNPEFFEDIRIFKKNIDHLNFLLTKCN